MIPSICSTAPFDRAAAVVMQRCDALAEISDEPGRITRTFLSPAARRAQGLVAGWMREAGLSVHVDAAGNVIGRREAGEARAKTVALGSHLDTVPNAGKYDGILGVLAGIGLAELTRDARLPFALEIVGFSEEEGVRFSKPFIGSHAYAGTLDPSWLQLTDKQGSSVERVLCDCGLDPAPLRAPRTRGDLIAFLELHIEQGPVLESLGVPLGIVSAIAGQTRMMLEFTGTAGHAGTTPMPIRADALAAAAEFILAAETVAQKTSGLVATVGHIEATPNATNVIPGSARISLDLRHAQDGVRTAAVADLLQLGAASAAQRGVGFQTLSRSDFSAVPMDAALLASLTNAARAHRPHVLVSGAGHDAAILAPITRAAMLFIRSPGGISHNPAEAVIPADLPLAMETLHTVLTQDPALRMKE